MWEKQKKIDLADYVLSRFSKVEREQMDVWYEKAVRSAVMILNGETDAAMNEYNRKAKQEEA